MDRATAILNAQIFRFNHVTVDAHSATEQHHTGQVPYYTDDVPARRKFKEGPSISAAKRATRGMKCVAALNTKEFILMITLAQMRRDKELARQAYASDWEESYKGNATLDEIAKQEANDA